jgi:hypothetical protein
LRSNPCRSAWNLSRSLECTRRTYIIVIEENGEKFLESENYFLLGGLSAPSPEGDEGEINPPVAFGSGEVNLALFYLRGGSAPSQIKKRRGGFGELVRYFCQLAC